MTKIILVGLIAGSLYITAGAALTEDAKSYDTPITVSSAISNDLATKRRAKRADVASRSSDRVRVASPKAKKYKPKVSEPKVVKQVKATRKKVELPKVSSSGNRKLGQTMAAARGWTGQEWVCLERLWTKESNWRTNADNPNSSAFGIPQALPGSKMSSAGADWRTNPATQIKWGLGYIGGRYGSPCGAWNHFLSKNWY